MQDIFAGCHTFVCGRTGTGKTTFAVNRLKLSRCPVLYYNVQGFETGFIRCDGSYDVKTIIRALRAGDKLDFVASRNIDFARAQLDYIIDTMFRQDCFRDRPIYIAIDEAQLVAAEGARHMYVDMIPTRGRVYGLQGIFITQRPALVSKTVITQCTRHIIFQTEYEDAYFKTKGLDNEKIKEMLGQDEHSYVIYEKGQYNGPYKEVLT